MVPHLFETSLCLRGTASDDGWFFVHVEFLIEVGGDIATLQGNEHESFFGHPLIICRVS
jgi:hypothetical protein